MSVLGSFSMFLGPEDVTTWKSCCKVETLIKIKIYLALNLGIVNVTALFTTGP